MVVHFQWTMPLFDIETKVWTTNQKNRNITELWQGRLNQQILCFVVLSIEKWRETKKKDRFSSFDSLQILGHIKWFQCNTSVYLLCHFVKRFVIGINSNIWFFCLSFCYLASKSIKRYESIYIEWFMLCTFYPIDFVAFSFLNLYLYSLLNGSRFKK